MNDLPIAVYLDFVRDHYKSKDPAHDFRHIERIASRLARFSEGMSPSPRPAMLCFLAAFHGLTPKLRNDEAFRAATTAFLATQGWSREAMTEALAAVQRHLADPQTVEEAIVHDANYIEAVGAFGIAKAFTTGGARSQSIGETADIYEHRYLDEIVFRTPTGQRASEEGRAYVKAFLSRLRSELGAANPEATSGRCTTPVLDFDAAGHRVGIRRPMAEDCDEFIALMQDSEAFHRPFLAPPKTAERYYSYVRSRHTPTDDGFLIWCRQTAKIVGVINLNCIVRGFFQIACLGYYIGAPYARQGYMSEAMRLVIDYAFAQMKLHRLEANPQPENAPSIALVRKCGFRKEGFSPRYLQVFGEWRDHERWALVSDEPRLQARDLQSGS